MSSKSLDSVGKSAVGHDTPVSVQSENAATTEKGKYVDVSPAAIETAVAKLDPGDPATARIADHLRSEVGGSSQGHHG